MSLSSSLANKAPLHRFVDGDRVYEVSFLVQSKRTAFERWLQDLHRDAVMELRDMLPEKEWLKRVDEYKSDADNFAFSFWGEKAKKAMGTTGGMIKLGCLLFGASEDEMFDLIVRRREEVQLMMDDIIRQSLPASKPGEDPKNDEAPMAK